MQKFTHTTGTFDGASGVKIFHQKWIPAGGVRRGVVVLVHGLGEHSDRYTNLCERLLPEGYAVYALDHQGFGRSGGVRGHVNRFRDYLLDVHIVAEMAHSEQADWPLAIYGHSMGGLIGLYYLLEYPDAVDYAVISAPALRAKTNRLLVWGMHMMNLLRPTFVLRRPGNPEGISRDPEEVRRFESDPLHVPVSSARWAVEILATQPEVDRRAAEITVPLLMVQGMADALVVPEATIDFFQRVASADKTLYTYEGYYHELHNDLGKEKPLDDIAQWLNERMPVHNE